MKIYRRGGTNRTYETRCPHLWEVIEFKDVFRYLDFKFFGMVKLYYDLPVPWVMLLSVSK